MSLDVYLHAIARRLIRKPAAESLSEEWRDGRNFARGMGALFPGQEPVVLTAEYGVDTQVFHRNITHNLGKMANAAGIYEALWRPEEIGITQAKQLIDPIMIGLESSVLIPPPLRLTIHPTDGEAIEIWSNSSLSIWRHASAIRKQPSPCRVNFHNNRDTSEIRGPVVMMKPETKRELAGRPARRRLSAGQDHHA